jgi:hypothetical protein
MAVAGHRPQRHCRPCHGLHGVAHVEPMDVVTELDRRMATPSGRRRVTAMFEAGRK